MYNLLSAFIGFLITFMIFINSTLSGKIDGYLASVVIHIVGLIGITMILILKKLKISFDRTLPLYLYSAGVIGVFTVLSNNLTFNKIGASLTLALGLFGQVVASILIDHFGALGMKRIPFDKRKFIGLFIIIIGISVMTVF